MKKIRCLIILGGGNSQLPFITAAFNQDITTIVIDRDPAATGFKFAVEKIVLSTYDSEAVVSRLKILAEKYSYVGLVARVSGPALFTASAISRSFDIAGVDDSLVEIATQKSKLRAFCVENNLFVPKGMKTDSAKSFAQNINYPIIIKPDYPIIGKKDIRVMSDSSQYEDAVIKACHASKNGYAEIQEYITGRDVSILFKISQSVVTPLFSWDELVGVEKNGSISGIGVQAPSSIKGTGLESKIILFIERFAQNLSNQIDSFLILSLRITDKGDIYVIELHADLGGDLIGDILLPKVYENLNYFDLIVNDRYNKTFDIKVEKVKPAIMLYSSKLDNINSKFLDKRNGVSLIQEKSQMESLKLASGLFSKNRFKFSPFN